MNALLRMLNLLLRSVLLVFSMLVVLLALFVSMGRELAPLLAEYRTEVQQQAQAALGMPLRIGRLQGSWRNLGPLLVAHDVQLGEGARSIQLQQLRLAPDLLGSLMQRRLVVERVELEGLKLNLQQIDAGNWQVKGWLPAQTPAAESALPDKSALLLGLSRVLLFNSQITLEPRGMAPVTFTYVNLGWRNSGTRQRLDGQITLPDGQPLSFSLKGRLDLADWQRSPAQLYLSLPQSDWARWMPAGLLPGLRAEVLQVGGEFWFSLAEGVLQRAVARVHAPQLRLGAGQNPTADVQDLAVTAYLDRDAQDYRLRLESLAFSLEQTRWGPAQLLLRQQTGSSAAAEQWQLQADHLQLEALAQLALRLAPVPEQAAVWLAGLDPRGQLSNLQVDYRPQQTDAGRLRFAANLESVAISAHLQVPGAEQVSGSIVGDLAGGELRLASEDFVLDLARIFPVPWRYRSAAAKLWWRVDEQGLSLGSPLIRLDGEEGRIAGDLLIRLPSAEDAKSYMDLRVGLRDGNAAYTEKYLPRPSEGFSAPLRDWLKVAIRAGSIDEGLFVFSGSLEAADSGEHEDKLSLFSACAICNWIISRTGHPCTRPSGMCASMLAVCR